ncbi:MAG: acyltransferase [Pseudomonadota bacterium]
MIQRSALISLLDRFLRENTGSGTNSGSYVLCLDGVRAASILLVLASHSLPLGPGDWLLNAAAGRMGMALFFCLSGYLIVSILYKDQRIIPFLAKRVTRVLPALFLYVTVLLIFFDLPWRSWLLNVTFLSNYHFSGLVGGPVGHLWSLCVEMHFYLAISVIVYLFGRNGLFLVFPAALIITAMRIDVEVNSHISTHLRADEIAVGGWLALISIHYGDRLRRWLSDLRVAAPLIISTSALVVLSSHDEGGFWVYLRPYLTMLLVGLIMHGNFPALKSILESLVAQFIAKISYALYLWHPLMLSGWFKSGSTIERYLLKRPISWALAFLAAHLSTKYWEGRCQRMVRSWLNKRDPQKSIA